MDALVLWRLGELVWMLERLSVSLKVLCSNLESVGADLKTKNG